MTIAGISALQIPLTKLAISALTLWHEELRLGGKLIVCKRCKLKRGKRWAAPCEAVDVGSVNRAGSEKQNAKRFGG
jgi:hypothetical protein